MNSPFQALLRKELAQHWVLALVLAGLLGTALLATVFALSMTNTTTTHFMALTPFSLGPMTLVAYLLGNRLIVAELYGRTQRFAEALPVSRTRIASVKFMVGLVFLWLAAGLAIACIAWLDSTQGGIPVTGILIITARITIAVLGIWSLVFLVSFLGRLRLPLILISIGLIVVLNELTAFDFILFGPMALLDGRTLAFEYVAWPWRSILETLALSLACITMSLLLATRNDGSIAETLAAPMSQRERTFAMMLCVLGVSAISLLDQARKPEPFSFESEFVVSSQSHKFQIMYLEEAYRESAEETLRRVEPWLSTIVDELAPEHDLPSIFVTLNLEQLEDAVASRADPEALVLSANFLSGDSKEPEDFGVVLAHDTLRALTRNRLYLESKHWLADGLARYWIESESEPQERTVARKRLALRALLAAHQLDIDTNTLLQWDRTAEAIGPELSMDLAYSAVLEIERRFGPSVVRSLARRMLSHAAHGDFRDWLHDRQLHVSDVFEELTGSPFPSFVDDWAARLKSKMGSLHAENIMPLAGGIESIRDSGRGRGISFQIEADTDGPISPRCRLRHQAIAPFDEHLDEHAMEEMTILWKAGDRRTHGRLSGHYGIGERVFVVLECRVDALNVWDRLAAGRFDVL